MEGFDDSLFLTDGVNAQTVRNIVIWKAIFTINPGQLELVFKSRDEKKL
jgi:hypothetical protein